MPRFDEVLAALARADVRFVVAGGVAVVLHGHPRMTADLDLVVDLAPAQVRRALDVFTGLGLEPTLPVDVREFAEPDTRRAWVDERGMTVFSLVAPDDPLHAVDLFAEPPAPFDELWDAARIVEVAGVEVPVASIDHLIRMKEAAGRPQDVADVAALRELRDG